MSRNTGCGRLTMGHIYIEPKRVSNASFWVRPDLPRDGVTKFAAKEMNAKVLLDDVSDREFQIIAARQSVLSVLIGLGKAKRTIGIRHAHVVSNN